MKPAVPADPERELVFLDMAGVRARWRPIRQALQDHVDENSPGWLPEDVYVELAAGRQHLFVPSDGAAGFLVGSTTTDGRGTIFWIWFAYGPGLGRDYWPAILDLARTAGASMIAFSSPLPMWERHAAKYGFVEARRIYERRI